MEQPTKRDCWAPGLPMSSHGLMRTGSLYSFPHPHVAFGELKGWEAPSTKETDEGRVSPLPGPLFSFLRSGLSGPQGLCGPESWLLSAFPGPENVACRGPLGQERLRELWTRAAAAIMSSLSHPINPTFSPAGLSGCPDPPSLSQSLTLIEMVFPGRQLLTQHL